MASPTQDVDKVNILEAVEKARKARRQACKKGSLPAVSDRILQALPTQQAGISADSLLSAEIPAFAGFVSGLSRLRRPFFLNQRLKKGFFNAKKPYTLTFVINPWNGEDADIVIANAKRTLNRARALLED